MSIPDFTFRNPQPALTRAEIAANVAALPMPDGWTLQDDVALMEGLFRLVGLLRIANDIGKPFDAVQSRFLQIRGAASCGPIPFGLDAQKHLLGIVRERAGT